MKPAKDSFLFFFVCMVFITIGSVRAQQQTDSSFYYYNILRQPTNHSGLHEAYIYFENNRKKRLREGDSLGAILYLRYIAEIQNKLGFSYESEISIAEALKLLDNLSGQDTLPEPRIGIYNHLGILYKQRNDYDKALYYYNRILNLTTDEPYRNAALNNKANVYIEQEQYTQALEELQQVYRYALREGNALRVARAMNNLGVVEAKLGMPEGLAHMNKALEIRKTENHTSGIITSYTHLIDYYRDQGDLKKADSMAAEARKIAFASKNPKWRSHVLSKIIDLKDDADILEFKRYTDSVTDAEQMQRNTYISAKYNFEVQERKAKESELQRVKERSRRIVFQFVLLFLVLMSIWIYRYLRIRHKRKIIEEVNATEAAISRKMHDEVANDMYRVMINLQTKYDLPPEILDDLERIYSMTRNLSREIQIPEPGIDYPEVLTGLLLQFRTEKVNIILKGLSDIPWESVKKDKKYMLSYVLMELMVNMRKHSEASVVLIQFLHFGRHVHVVYKDNGKGSTQKKGKGLTNVETRMKLVGGTVSFVSEPEEGFYVKIII